MTSDLANTPKAVPEAPRQTLAEALEEAFNRKSSDSFALRATRLVQAILNVQRVGVLVKDPETPWRSVAPRSKGAVTPEWTALGDALAASDAGRPVIAAAPWIGARICLETGREAVLIAEIPKGGQTALAMAHERLTLLSRMSYTTFAPEEMTALRHVMGALSRIPQEGRPAMQKVADGLAELTGASFAALARYDGSSIADLSISGQADTGRRGALVARLKSEMAETAQTRLTTETRAFGGAEGRVDGLVFQLEGAERNESFLPLIAAAAARLSISGTAPRKARLRRWARRAAILGVLAALSLVPLPDGIDLPATVAAKSQRIVTSPLDAPVAAIDVSENDLVIAGQTVLARLETREIDLELIAAQARYSNALLEREAVRAARRAADLRTAELEVARIEAEVALLETKRAAAILIAPISGIVLGQGLSDLQGANVRRGDRLLEIADPSTLALDVAVPQRQVGRVAAGQTGLFRPDFDPSLRIETALTQLSPAAPAGERNPVFAADATLSGDVTSLRPGMTGVLALNRTYTPVWQILWRETRDWVLLRLWI